MQPLSRLAWRSHPSQWINAKSYSFAAISLVALWFLNHHGVLDQLFHFPFLYPHKAILKALLFMLPIGYAIWCWLSVHFHIYELTEEVLREHYGVLNRVSQELELYRVNDSMIYKPFELNVMGLGNVILHTTDSSTPIVVIQAIAEPDRLRELIRHFVEQQRQRRGVVEIGNR